MAKYSVNILTFKLLCCDAKFTMYLYMFQEVCQNHIDNCLGYKSLYHSFAVDEKILRCSETFAAPSMASRILAIRAGSATLSLPAAARRTTYLTHWLAASVPVQPCLRESRRASGIRRRRSRPAREMSLRPGGKILLLRNSVSSNRPPHLSDTHRRRSRRSAGCPLPPTPTRC